MKNSLTVVAKVFSNTLIFLLQKHAMQNLLTFFFSQKYQCICHISRQFNVTLDDNYVKF